MEYSGLTWDLKVLTIGKEQLLIVALFFSVIYCILLLVLSICSSCTEWACYHILLCMYIMTVKLTLTAIIADNFLSSWGCRLVTLIPGGEAFSDTGTQPVKHGPAQSWASAVLTWHSVPQAELLRRRLRGFLQGGRPDWGGEPCSCWRLLCGEYHARQLGDTHPCPLPRRCLPRTHPGHPAGSRAGPLAQFQPGLLQQLLQGHRPPTLRLKLLLSLCGPLCGGLFPVKPSTSAVSNQRTDADRVRGNGTNAGQQRALLHLACWTFISSISRSRSTPAAW